MLPNKIPSLMILFMTALSVWTLPHSSPNDRLNAVVNDLAQVATDYTIFHKSIKDFTGQKTAFNTINLHERMVEAHLRNTINDAVACSPLNETGSQMIMDGLAKPYPAFMQDLLEGITNKVRAGRLLPSIYVALIEGRNRSSSTLRSRRRFYSGWRACMTFLIGCHWRWRRRWLARMRRRLSGEGVGVMGCLSGISLSGGCDCRRGCDDCA